MNKVIIKHTQENQLHTSVLTPGASRGTLLRFYVGDGTGPRLFQSLLDGSPVKASQYWQETITTGGGNILSVVVS